MLWEANSDKIGLALPKHVCIIVFDLAANEQSPSFYKGQGLCVFPFLDLKIGVDRKVMLELPCQLWSQGQTPDFVLSLR